VNNQVFPVTEETALHGVNWTAELVIAGIKEVLRARPGMPSLGSAGHVLEARGADRRADVARRK
jgi:hypothetical protein